MILDSNEKLSGRLRRAEKAIIDKWKIRMAKELGMSNERIAPAWEGYVSQFLHDLEDALDRPKVGWAIEAAEQSPLIVEFGLLARTIIDELESATPLTHQEKERILDAVQRKVSGAVALERRAFDQAAQNLAELNALLEATPTGVGLLDRDFRYLRVNKVLARMNGASVEDHIGRTVRQVLGDVDGGFIEPFLIKVLETGQAQKFEGVIRLPSQGIRNISGTFYPVRQGGSIFSIGATLVDVTDLKQREHDIETVNFLLKALVEGMDDPAYIKALDGKLLLCNAATAKLYGKTPEELIGTVAIRQFPPETYRHLHDIEEEIIKTGELRKYEETLSLYNGTQRTFLTSKGPYRDPSGRIIGLFGVSRDITELRRATEDLVRLNAQLKAEREIGEQFSAALSHDLRNPLGAIRNNAELLFRASNLAGVKETAERMIKITDRANDMLEDLLNVYRSISGGKYPLTMATCDFVEDFKRLLDEYSQRYENRVVLIAPAPLQISCDCRALLRALDNLITNALKFGDPTKPVAVHLAEDQGCITLSVHNEGNPIPAGAIPNLFRPFQTLRGVKSKHGWGIGLALVRTIIEGHQGTIEVSSSEAKGTTFTIKLPKLETRGSRVA